MKSSIFRQPSFLKGIARTFDLFGKLDGYKISQTSDAELLRQDWENIGNDLQKEINKHVQRFNR